jgi:Fic family protein
MNLTMKTFERIPLPITSSWLLSSCMEAKGKQDLWLRQKPEVIAALREQAIIQSVESSNRIEGVTVERDRLRPIIVGNSRPRDRSEEELVGYRNALRWMFSAKRAIPVTPKTILRLHSLAQGGHSGDAGKWKARDNEIIELLPNGERRIRFTPTPAKQVPKAMEKLCRAYGDLCAEGQVPPPLLAATFVFDFLCIHPFRDGNGRVSRLLTTLLLQEHGFLVGRFLSMERLIEESKADYYDILETCSNGWHESKNELLPWWNYFLSILHRAYQEFSERVENAEGMGKAELVRQTITRQIGPFTLADVHAECPSVSSQLIKKVLSELKNSGEVKLAGHGRGAKWTLK